MLLLGSIALQLVNPQVVGYFLDTVQSGGPESLLLGAAVVFCALAVTQKGIAYAAFRVSQHVGWTATNAVRADLTRHCLRLDLPFHKRHTPGALIERVDGDVNTLENFCRASRWRRWATRCWCSACSPCCSTSTCCAGLGMTAYALLTFLALGALQRVAVGRWAASRQASADGYGFIEERIAGTEDIRPNGGEPYVMRQLYGLMRALMERLRTARVVSNLTFITTNFSAPWAMPSGWRSARFSTCTARSAWDRLSDRLLHRHGRRPAGHHPRAGPGLPTGGGERGAGGRASAPDPHGFRRPWHE